MSNIFLVWGNIKDKYYTKKAIEIPETKLKYDITKMYAFKEALIFISQGDIYIEGCLPFEKSITNKNYNDSSYKDNKSIKKYILNEFENEIPKLIILKSPSNLVNIVTDISIGDNHILIITKNNQLYSWGDNYYGQLGIEGYFVPYINSPSLVKLSSVESAMAYKNNNFAIDVNKKLYVWGKSSLLGIKTSTNFFKPKLILKHQYIHAYKINDGRLVFQVKHNKISNIKNEDDANDKVNQFKNKVNNKNKENNNNICKLNKSNCNLNSSIPFINNSCKKSTNHISNIQGEKKIILMDIHKMDNILSCFYNNINNSLRPLYKIMCKSFIHSKKNIIKIGWDSINEEIKLLYKEKTNNKLININLTNFKDFNEYSNEIGLALKSILCNKEIVIQKDNDKNSYTKMHKFFEVNLKSNYLKDVAKSNQMLIMFSLKLKKLQVLTFYLNNYNFYLKSPKILTKIEALDTIKFRTFHINKELEIINKFDEHIKNNINNLSKYYTNINYMFEVLPDINFQTDLAYILSNNCDEEQNINIITQDELNYYKKLQLQTSTNEKFLYKTLIDSLYYKKYILENLLNSLDVEYSVKLAIDKEKQLIPEYKELYSIQIYINSLGMKNLIETKNESNFILENRVISSNNRNNDSIGKKNINIKGESHILNELNGIIVNLERIIQRKLDSKSANISSELILYYAYSLLDLVYLKKYCLSMQKRIGNTSMKKS